MAGYIGSKTVNLSTTGADIAGDADVSGALDVGGGLTVDNDGSTVLTVDRATSDGTIIDLQKSGSSVGSIGAYNSATGIISGSAASYTGIYLNTNKIEPAGNNFGSEIRADNTVDVGSSSYRFKDLYLSGDIAHKDAAGNARLLYDKSANLLGNAGTYLYGFGVYLGGNGFYWRIVRHPEDSTLLEIRRSEDGLRAWASEPGEYYNAFDGSYGGLWRRNGRPPQQLVGIGFTAQGNFVGMPYKRVCYDKNMDWVFDGINDDLLGDFGFSGHGAAGFELDRRDEKLDDGEDIIILAQSYDEDNRFILVPEEMLTHLTNLSGVPEADVKRADMVYFKTHTGGQVFAAGSITFCGSLPWNNYDNNVSKLLRNVVRKFVGS